MSEYVFEGEVVKLNLKEFYRLADIYKALDLVAELKQIDGEFAIKKESGRNVDGWHIETYRRFNARNKIAMDRLARMPHTYSNRQLVAPKLTKEMSLEQQLVDKSWASGIKTIN